MHIVFSFVLIVFFVRLFFCFVLDSSLFDFVILSKIFQLNQPILELFICKGCRLSTISLTYLCAYIRTRMCLCTKHIRNDADFHSHTYIITITSEYINVAIKLRSSNNKRQ